MIVLLVFIISNKTSIFPSSIDAFKTAGKKKFDDSDLDMTQKPSTQSQPASQASSQSSNTQPTTTLSQVPVPLTPPLPPHLSQQDSSQLAKSISVFSNSKKVASKIN